MYGKDNSSYGSAEDSGRRSYIASEDMEAGYESLEEEEEFARMEAEREDHEQKYLIA